jgi:phosphoglycerol transferase MdoB-like AlkP superfamily enzyme
MKQFLLKVYHNFIDFVKYNKQFCSYVILAVCASVFVRYYTSGNLSLAPLIFDITMPILIGAFSYLNKPKKQFNYLFICLLILSIMCIINTIYYTFYSSYVSFSLITALGQVGEVGDALFEKLRLIQFIYLLSPALFIVINRRLNSKDYFNYITKIEDSKKLFKKVLITGLVLLALGAATLSKTSYSRLAKQWNREYILNRFGVVIYQVNDLVNTLKPTISSWFGYDVSYKKFVDYYENNSLEVSDNEYTNMFKDYNVVFVHMESMTSFLIDLEINGISIAPNLTKLSQEGMYFSNFYPQIGVGTSSDSEFTLSTSLMPASNGTAFVSYFDREYSTIQKLMKDEGYYTFSMHGNKASMWNRSNMHPSLGYMDFYSKTSFVIDEEVGLGLSDKSFFRQAIPILENIEENNEKYMGTIITLSNHTPFDNNELFEQIDLTYHTTQYNEDTKEDEEVVYDYLEGTKLGDYIRSSHYADDALGEFISYIQESDYFDNTLFVFYGDHDPKLALSEFYNYYNFDPETGEILDESSENYVAYDYYSNELNKKTPLILWTKNKKLSQEVSYYMGMIDVSPTIGNMVGIYNEYALGHDIFEIKNDNIIAFPNGNFLTSKVYYRDSKEEYKPLNLDEALSDSYIKECKVYVDNIIDISNGIIVHDLIKASKNKESTKELK